MKNEKIVGLLHQIEKIYEDKKANSVHLLTGYKSKKEKLMLIGLFLLSGTSVLTMFLSMFFLGMDFKNNTSSFLPMIFIITSISTGISLFYILKYLEQSFYKDEELNNHELKQEETPLLSSYQLEKEQYLKFYKDIESVIGIEKLSEEIEKMKKYFNTEDIGNILFIKSLLNKLK